MTRDYIKELCLETKSLKIYKTIKSKHFKKRIKIFKKKDTQFINPNLKRVFKKTTVKDWYILSTKIEKILKQEDYKLKSSRIISTLILSFISPEFEYLLSSYYHSSSKRIPKIKLKFLDIQFLVKSLILNNDKDVDHLKLIKHKLNHIGISNYKLVFEHELYEINNKEQLNSENHLSITEKSILTHYLTSSRRKRNFKIYKISKNQVFDAFFLFFLDLSDYELSKILFYKKNLNYFDYDFEVFVLKKKEISP